MSVKRLEAQQKRREERIAEEKRKAVERVRRETEVLRLLTHRLKEARRMQDKHVALKLGDVLIRVLRGHCAGFFDDEGQFDAPMLVGALLDAHARLEREPAVAARWMAAGETHLPRRTKGCNASDAAASPAKSLLFGETDPETPPEASDGLPSIDALFNGGGLRS